jgi:hypothetical protein
MGNRSRLSLFKPFVFILLTNTFILFGISFIFTLNVSDKGQLRTVMDTRTNVDSHGYTKWCEQSRIHKNVCYDRVQSMVDYPQRNVEYPLMERKSKQQWLTIPQISSKRTTTSHLKSLKTKRKDHDVWRWRSRSFMHVATLCIQLSW